MCSEAPIRSLGPLELIFTYETDEDEDLGFYNFFWRRWEFKTDMRRAAQTKDTELESFLARNIEPLARGSHNEEDVAIHIVLGFKEAPRTALRRLQEVYGFVQTLPRPEDLPTQYEDEGDLETELDKFRSRCVEIGEWEDHINVRATAKDVAIYHRLYPGLALKCLGYSLDHFMRCLHMRFALTPGIVNGAVIFLKAVSGWKTPRYIKHKERNVAGAKIPYQVISRRAFEQAELVIKVYSQLGFVPLHHQLRAIEEPPVWLGRAFRARQNKARRAGDWVTYQKEKKTTDPITPMVTASSILFQRLDKKIQQADTARL